jgi:histidinol-phosphate aminotransferase
MKFNFKPELLNIERKRAGSPDRLTSGDLYLDRNERAQPFAPEVMAELGERIAGLRINQYPELEPFYDKVAAWAGAPRECLFITEGVSGAVKSLLEAFAPKGSDVVFPSPTFALYPVYCRMFGAQPVTVGYTDGYELDLDALRGAIGPQTSMVFLPNPNVPIEGYIGIEQIADLARHCECHDAILVVDEVYHMFGGDSAFGLVDAHPNVMIMRSFSKGFGLPSVRIGYVIGPADLIDYLARVRTGYETSMIAAEVVDFFLERQDLVRAYIAEVKEGLAYLRDALAERGIHANGGRTGNFVYADLGSAARAQSLVAELKRHGVHIRGGWPQPYDGGVAISGAPKVLMQRLLDAWDRVEGKSA